MLTDRDTLRRLLRQHGLRPRTSLGQHFLIDASVAQASLSAADLRATDTVLEIGAGLGSLTDHLLTTGCRVIAVERDRQLAAVLAQRCASIGRLTVLAQDIFSVRLDQYVHEGAYAVVANLPYNISSLVLRNFLTLSPRPTTMVLLLQREVADRLVGKDGDRSLLTLLAALTARVEVLRLVERTAFLPTPAVTSALVRLKLKSFDPRTEKILRLARLAFAGRRKQIKNSLAAGLQMSAAEVEKVLKEAKISVSARPQELELRDWERLYAVALTHGVVHDIM